MLACTALVGCTNDDDIDNVVPENNEKNLYAIKINLNFPKKLDQSSRALAGFADGTPAEHNVKNCIVRFYDATKKYLGSTTMTEEDFEDVGTTTDNITKAGEVTFRSVSKPAYVVAIVNDRTATESLGNIEQNTIDDLKNMVVYDEANALGSSTNSLIYPLSSTANVENSNFLMTNSTYKEGNEIVQEVRLPEKSVVEITASMEDEDAFAQITNPAVIYVERVVAKVNLNMNLVAANNKEVTVEGKTGVYQLKYTTTGEEEGDWAPYAIHVLGWGLNATNKSFYPLKRIQSNWVASWYGTGRSFWANDKNHGTPGTYLTTNLLETPGFNYVSTNYDLNYRKLDQINGAINTPEYCYENTVGANPTDNSVTHAVIKVRYMEQNANGAWDYVPENEYVYRINQVIWNETNFKKHIASYLIDKYIYKVGDTQLDQDGLAEMLEFSVDAVTAEVNTITMDETVSVFEKNGTTEVNVTNWKPVANPGTIVAYKDGFCYYTIPIKHFEVVKNAEGHYGVVRNHWYELTVTSIAGFGEPGTGNPIIPEEEQLKDWAVKCNINILAWSKVTQDNIEVGGGATWN